MNAIRSVWLLLIVLALVPAGTRPARSQSVGGLQPADVAAGVEAPPVYLVEIVIFAYNDFNPYEEEFRPSVPHWPKQYLDVAVDAARVPREPGPEAWHLDDVLEPAGAGYQTSYPPVLSPTAPSTTADEFGNTMSPAPAATPFGLSASGAWYRLLDRDRLELGRVLNRLNTLDAYTPLVHVGWAQVTMLEDEAKPFELAWLGRLQPTGSIRLHRSRFLHLTVDVGLQDSYRYTQAPLPPDARWPLAEFVGPVRYQINVQRRVRIGELNFFDHPAFGVLITVKPAPADPQSGEAPSASGPAA